MTFGLGVGRLGSRFVGGGAGRRRLPSATLVVSLRVERRGGACAAGGVDAGANGSPLGSDDGFAAGDDAGREDGLGDGFGVDRQADTSNRLAMATSR